LSSGHSFYAKTEAPLAQPPRVLFVGARGAAHLEVLDLCTEARLRQRQRRMLPIDDLCHAAIYSLDVLLPIVDLGQESAWIPHGVTAVWSWFEILFGWVLTTAAVAGLTSVLRRGPASG